MPSTVNIPLTTLAPGTFSFPSAGGQAIADADTLITLSIDRTVTNGLNSQPGTTTIEIQTFQSYDGGATWFNLAGALISGGTFTNKGVTVTHSMVITALQPGTSREVRAVVTVSGASVAVAGSLTTQ